MQIPQFLHTLHPAYRGIPVHLNSDEFNYLPRVQEALSGRPGEAAEAIVGDERVLPMQPALIEQAYGFLFFWTGWRAATVLQVMDSVIPPLVLLALYFFFLSLGFERRWAYAGAILWILLNLYSLNRPIHQRTSFLLELLALIGIMRGIGGKVWWGILGGVLMGLLVPVYFWSWTYAWCWFGLIVVCEMLRRLSKKSEIQVIFLFGFVGVIVALPFLWDMWELAQHPLYGEVQYRSGLLHSRSPQSWTRSLLFLGMVFGISGTKYRYAFITVLTAFIVLNQQVVHGVILFFSSHYLSSLILAGVTCLLVSIHMKSKSAIFSGLCAVIFLSGIAYDGRYLVNQFIVRDHRFDEQHFANLLPVLDALPRTRILSDRASSLFIAAHTRHDVVYSVYLKNVLISDVEFAERYCLTQLPVSPDRRNIGEAELLLHFEQRGRSEDERRQEIRTVEDACVRMDADPRGFLALYGVDHVLWDEKRQPDWNISGLGLALVDQGDSWSLWKV